MSKPSVDLFLTFLSEKGQGRWDELKDAWSWLAGAAGEPDAQAWIAARDLEALGHIEVGWEQGMAWCAAPPLLTMIPRSGGRVFLTGARTRQLEMQLEEAASELDLGSTIARRGRDLGRSSSPATVLNRFRTLRELSALVTPTKSQTRSPRCSHHSTTTRSSTRKGSCHVGSKLSSSTSRAFPGNRPRHATPPACTAAGPTADRFMVSTCRPAAGPGSSKRLESTKC